MATRKFNSQPPLMKSRNDGWGVTDPEATRSQPDWVYDAPLLAFNLGLINAKRPLLVWLHNNSNNNNNEGSSRQPKPTQHNTTPTASSNHQGSLVLDRSAHAIHSHSSQNTQATKAGRGHCCSTVVTSPGWHANVGSRYSSQLLSASLEAHCHPLTVD
jgi:hypothetical protein